MDAIQLIRRYGVSPAQFEEAREYFPQLAYLEPRIYKNNCRYRNLRRIQDTITGKVYHESWNQKIIELSKADEYFTVSKAEENRLDIIAYNYYSTPKYWWVIALANYIIDPFDIPAYSTIRIPPITALYDKGGVLSNG